MLKFHGKFKLNLIPKKKFSLFNSGTIFWEKDKTNKFLFP